MLNDFSRLSALCISISVLSLTYGCATQPRSGIAERPTAAATAPKTPKASPPAIREAVRPPMTDTHTRSDNGSEAGETAAARAASHALQMVGRAYRYGGSHPSTGFDCSGLLQYSFRRAGVSIPRSTEAQRAFSGPIRASALRRGDLLFFDQEGKKNSHVGMYLGEGKFVHAPSSGKQVRVDRLDAPYWRRHLSETRRIGV